MFADRLKEALNNKNMKQIDLVRCAQEKGVKLGKSHVSQYLSGKTIPRAEILHFIAETLQVEESWLLDENVRTVGKGAERTKEKTVNVEPKEKMIKKTEDPEKKNLESQETEESAVREFKKSSKLNNVLYDVRGPVVEEASRMEAAGTQVLKLNIGNPAPFGFRTPDEVIYDMSQQLSDCEGYSPSQGLFSARKAIMQYSQIKKLPNVTISDIYTGNGVSELINLCM